MDASRDLEEGRLRVVVLEGVSEWLERMPGEGDGRPPVRMLFPLCLLQGD